MKHKIKIKKNTGTGYTMIVSFSKEGSKYSADYSFDFETKKEAKEWEAKNKEWIQKVKKNVEKE
jgi:hypothetical protein